MNTPNPISQSESPDEFSRFPTRRQKISNWIWFAYNTLSFAGIVYTSYTDGFGWWGKVCAVVALLVAISFVTKGGKLITTSATETVMRNTFVYVVLGYLIGAASFWGGGASLSIVAYPVFLSLFFVHNQRFISWTNEK